MSDGAHLLETVSIVKLRVSWSAKILGNVPNMRKFSRRTQTELADQALVSRNTIALTSHDIETSPRVRLDSFAQLGRKTTRLTLRRLKLLSTQYRKAKRSVPKVLVDMTNKHETFQIDINPSHTKHAVSQGNNKCT